MEVYLPLMEVYLPLIEGVLTSDGGVPIYPCNAFILAEGEVSIGLVFLDAIVCLVSHDPIGVGKGVIVVNKEVANLILL